MGAKISITNPLDGSSETLAATPAGNIKAPDLVFANGTLTITGLASPADYQAVLRLVYIQHQQPESEYDRAQD